MAILKCKMCGGDLNITADEKIIECEYCGTTQTIPDGSDEKKTNLFNRANRLRMDNEFDKAAGVYESIVSEFPEEAEGYWGLVLCAYGIAYVDDAKTGKKIPTCHRTLTSSVMDDDNFTQACENADVVARGVYREEAKAIDRLQQQIIAVVENEEPYDVFICYKETDDITKQRTEDSLIAQDIYTELIKEGYKVFFSRVTLRDKAGTEYEPYIYAALKSAKIMLAIGTKFDYYDAVWVKNEWSRYISMMADDSSKHLIPCFKNLDAYDIPKEFKNLQALDMGEVTFFKNLLVNVERFIPKATAAESITEHIKVVETVASSNASVVAPLLKRAFMFLEEGNFKSAKEYCEKVLDLDPECAEAYLGKLMVECKAKTRESLQHCGIAFYAPIYKDSSNYLKAIRFADENLKAELEGYALAAKKEIEKRRESEERKRRAEEEERKKQCEKKIVQHCIRSRQTCISAYGLEGVVAVKTNGMVFNTTEIDVSKWTDIVAVSASEWHILGLKTDGTVIEQASSCVKGYDVSGWKNIISISAGGSHAVGLRSDGTVVAVGDNDHGQCNVQAWEDIVAVCAGWNHTVGLKADGTAVAVGANDVGQCNVQKWQNIVAVSASVRLTVGLNAEGETVAVGYGDKYAREKNVVAVATSNDLIRRAAFLKADGTVELREEFDSDERLSVRAWRNIVSVSACRSGIVGLTSDGTIFDTRKGAAQGAGGIAVPIFAKTEEEYEVENRKRLQNIQEYTQEYTKKQQLRQERRNAGVCQYCGGQFKGLFTKTCAQCGKKKDY